MFYNQHISHKWHVFVIFFVSCPETPMDVSSVDSFPVQFGGSLMTFLALSGVES